jgi:hypothetical protein
VPIVRRYVGGLFMSIVAHRDGDLIYCPITGYAVGCDACGEHLFWLDEQKTCPHGCQDCEGAQEIDPWLSQTPGYSDMDLEVA